MRKCAIKTGNNDVAFILLNVFIVYIGKTQEEPKSFEYSKFEQNNLSLFSNETSVIKNALISVMKEAKLGHKG